MWHVACDTWHVTRNMWHMRRLRGWIFSQNFSSLALTVCDIMKIWRKRLTDLINEWINEEAVYRIAPGTPGLLKMLFWMSSLTEALVDGRWKRHQYWCQATIADAQWHPWIDSLLLHWAPPPGRLDSAVRRHSLCVWPARPGGRRARRLARRKI